MLGNLFRAAPRPSCRWLHRPPARRQQRRQAADDAAAHFPELALPQTSWMAPAMLQNRIC